MYDCMFYEAILTVHIMRSMFISLFYATIFFFSAEVDLQKLSHALKILSETEKQLRMSKNQTTWLTVALLQLSSIECSSADAKESNLWLDNAHDRGENCSIKIY